MIVRHGNVGFPNSISKQQKQEYKNGIATIS